MTVSVLLVDDDALVRAGLRMVLSADDEIDVIGEAVDGDAGVATARRLHPDVILMDLQMPARDGIGATRELRRLGEQAAIVILTTFAVDEHVVDALRAGANGYLLKDADPTHLARAVHAAAAGESVFTASITERLVRRAANDRNDQLAAERRLAGLTDRERTVAESVAAGLSNAAIAEELVMSEATVKTHVSRILTKLNAENRVQIAIVVFESRGRG